ncbi:hypothetical protein GTF97_14485 [Roseobacter sp. HKCCD8767]|uniref:hypothetical protein n=1 Tax=unclassified Roseobacter TaxID=196798 RepID=UPI0014919A32|nr:MULTISPECIES: hypothetical protein [unclassified Roseobacter]MBF9051447.1 hypothetical protein [Rhodobacterales bacterium HKCCD4356]NNV12971.1 hypothetical protein [Roseobacter sp. HKCCD7357]NNV52229.1 hypothetical protein [Roseobacter sp. HKCCD9025]NNV82035.1 hypothetical protein [Roseobacter sp. HKCCD6547]NNV94809.1 hypothetical protein [Roseobacter sp. HKCCD8914]NNW11998.1 hypothetical protein [Roseobacter sp. HKCCD8484]NNW20509.1 hypothetical protein [Roseobacter sp. HKCCD7543]NNW461
MSDELYAEREDYEDGFSIVTKSGLRITKDKLTVSRPFSVDGNKTTIDAVQTFQRLQEQLNELLNLHLID